MNNTPVPAFRQTANARILRAVARLLEGMADELEHDANTGLASGASNGALELLNESVVNAIAGRFGGDSQRDEMRAMVWTQIRELIRLEASAAALAAEQVRR
jgi:hypothetical protein